MSLRTLGAIFFGGCFTVVNALMLFLTGVWLRFSNFEARFPNFGTFTIPGGRLSDTFDTIDVEFYQAIPFGVVPLLIVSSTCLYAHVRLVK